MAPKIVSGDMGPMAEMFSNTKVPHACFAGPYRAKLTSSAKMTWPVLAQGIPSKMASQTPLLLITPSARLNTSGINAQNISNCSSSQLLGTPGTGDIFADEAENPQLFLRAREETFSCIQGPASTTLKGREWGKKEMSCRGLYWILSWCLTKMTFLKKICIFKSITLCYYLSENP